MPTPASWSPHWTHFPPSRLHTCIFTHAEGSGFPTWPAKPRCSRPGFRPSRVSSSALDADRPTRRLNSFGPFSPPLAPSPPPLPLDLRVRAVAHLVLKGQN